MSGSIARVIETELNTKSIGQGRIGNDLLRNVRVSLEVRLGETSMTLEEVMALKAGAVVTLETGLADHVDVYLNGSVVARGEIVAVGDKFGLKIIDVA